MLAPTDKTDPPRDDVFPRLLILAALLLTGVMLRCSGSCGMRMEPLFTMGLPPGAARVPAPEPGPDPEEETLGLDLQTGFWRATEDPGDLALLLHLPEAFSSTVKDLDLSHLHGLDGSHRPWCPGYQGPLGYTLCLLAPIPPLSCPELDEPDWEEISWDDEIEDDVAITPEVHSGHHYRVEKRSSRSLLPVNIPIKVLGSDPGLNPFRPLQTRGGLGVELRF